MKIERSATVLTVKDTPGCMWVFGAFFAVVGLTFVYGASGGYSNFDEMSAWAMALHLFFGSVAAAAGVWIIFISPRTVLSIDRNTEQVTLKRRGLGGRSGQSFAFDEIRNFSLLEEADTDGDPMWSLKFDTLSGEDIRVTSVASPLRNSRQDIAFELNQFMYKQMPSYRAANLPEDEDRGQIG